MTLHVNVLNGEATTSCIDIISLPDPLWGVSVEGLTTTYFDLNSFCWNDFPAQIYQITWPCASDVPDSIQLCFTAFENDPPLFSPCTISPDCQEILCMKAAVPLMGNDTVILSLPPGLSSGGFAEVELRAVGFPGGLNDDPCDAIDLGTLTMGITAGNADSSLFNNYCATAANEPDPWPWSGWINNRAVWFKFSTGPEPSSHVKVRLESDPSNFGDPVNLQAALWKSSSGCSGPWSFVLQNHNPATWGEELLLVCPDPNTTYYLMVDAVWDDTEQLEGWFGVQAQDLAVMPVPDVRCEALNLGAVPNSDTLQYPMALSNSCSANSDPETVSSFSVQKGVWLKFTPPASGHVIINASSLGSIDPIDLQLALFESSDGDCNASFTEKASSYGPGIFNELMTVHCLDPSKSYYLLVDGGGNAAAQSGVFELKIIDGGDDTPVTNQDITLCAGDTLNVGTQSYTMSGSYSDTLYLPDGCDSIVNTNLTVLPPIELALTILKQGLNPGNDEGVAGVNPTGGAGGFSITWSNGQTTQEVTGLIGGELYCVTVTDAAGCFADTCFEMPYYVQVQPLVMIDSVSCPGGEDGQIHISAMSGKPPYDFQWEAVFGSPSGMGTIAADSAFETIPGLAAGAYQITLSDEYTDTTFTVVVLEPAPLAVESIGLQNASCFGFCDGQLTVLAHGGTPPYQYQWQHGANGESIYDLCAGEYTLLLTDGHGCMATFLFEISQPLEFIAEVIEENDVSCHGGSDGSLSVSTNGSPIAWNWSNGGVTSVITNLPAGYYEVTVTNTDGCTATATYELGQPIAPVEVLIEQVSPVICHGDANGVLQAVVSGPGQMFQYHWSVPAEGPLVANLPGGIYTVTVVNEQGCEATTDYLLEDPAPIVAKAKTNSLSCLDPPDGGVITVAEVQGGRPPYKFSSDGSGFSPDSVLKGYFAGQNSYFVQDSEGCTEVFFATIPGPVELIVFAGPDRSIRLGEEIQLDPFVNVAEVTVQWSPPELFQCPQCLSSSCQPLETTVLTLTVTDTFGCTASDHIKVDVYAPRKLYVPNAFSPNGDGVNDYLVPQGGTDIARIEIFRVFDRYGALMHEAFDFLPGDTNAGWDGKHLGKALDPAVFTWYARVLYIDGNEETHAGDVVLMK